jgi:hypothetical protein
MELLAVMEAQEPRLLSGAGSVHSQAAVELEESIAPTLVVAVAADQLEMAETPRASLRVRPVPARVP